MDRAADWAFMLNRVCSDVDDFMNAVGSRTSRTLHSRALQREHRHSLDAPFAELFLMQLSA